MADITLSLGWLFAHGQTALSDQRPFFEHADGVEMNITSLDRFDTYETPLDTGRISFHIAPEDTHIEAVTQLADRHNPEAVVVHPDILSDSLAQTYVDEGTPLSIENMDTRKDSGFEVEELENLLTAHEATFTLDVQHAYEHDPSMEYAWDLVKMADSRLSELHVSGETKDCIHALVHKANNREAILTFLREFYASGYSAPMVIEGKYETVDDVRREVDLLRTAY